MADKNLRISVKSDLKDGQKLTRFLKELQTLADKLSKTVGNMNIGGGDVGPGGQPRGDPTLRRGPHSGLFKQLTEDKRAMSDMGREVESLERRFRNLGNTAGSAMSRAGGGLVDQFGRPMAPSGRGGGLPPIIPGVPGGLAPGGGPPGPGGGGGINWTGQVGGLLGRVGRMAGWGSVLANVRDLLIGPERQNLAWAQNAVSQMAGGAAGPGGMGAQLLGGSFAPAMGFLRLTGNAKGATAGGGMDDLRAVLKAAPGAQMENAISKIANPAMLMHIRSSINQFGRDVSPQTMARAAKEAAIGFVGKASELDPISSKYMEYAQSQAAGRVGFARRFGRDFSAGTALGANVDPQQVMATVSATLDALGTGSSVTKVTRLVTEATRLGISNEAIQTMLRAQEVGGGNLMDRVLRSGLSRPMMGAAGTAAAGMAASSLLRLSPDTFVGGFTSGGARTDELTMRQLQAGQGFLNQVTTGGLDPYQKTVNMALATKRGRSVFTTSMMGKMSLAELMQAAKHPTAEQLAAGIKATDARELLNSEVNSLAARAFGESGVNQPPAIRRLLEATRGAGGIMGAAERFRKQGAGGAAALRELETGLSMVTDQPLGGRPLQFLTGAQAGGRGGALPKETSGGFTNALKQLMGAQGLLEDPGRLSQALENLGKVAASSKGLLETLNDVMTSGDTQSISQVMEGTADAMKKITANADAVKVLEDMADRIKAIRDLDSSKDPKNQPDVAGAANRRIEEAIYKDIHGHARASASRGK